MIITLTYSLYHLLHNSHPLIFRREQALLDLDGAPRQEAIEGPEDEEDGEAGEGGYTEESVGSRGKLERWSVLFSIWFSSEKWSET